MSLNLFEYKIFVFVGHSDNGVSCIVDSQMLQIMYSEIVFDVWLSVAQKYGIMHSKHKVLLNNIWYSLDGICKHKIAKNRVPQILAIWRV